MSDTIFALSSGGLPSGVAVIRISGPGCRDALQALAGPLPGPRVATLRAIGDADGSVIDRGLVIWFPGPHSFTGEDVGELQIHGGRATVAALLRRLGAIDGLRPALAGEFTRRALIEGRFDLTQVEGLGDLLAAETEAQRRQALRQSEGELRALYGGWRRRMIEVRALIEAHFDFSEEEDVPGEVIELAWQKARLLADEIRRHLGDGHRSERLRSGVEVVLLGRPNVGKSSLLNALARREAAIVTAEPGTTRDVIEVRLDLRGVPVTVIDTAGLREAAGGAIEAEGMRRARARAEGADLVLSLESADVAALDGSQLPEGVPVWRVATKSDMAGSSVRPATAEAEGGASRRWFSVSAATGAGLADLEAALADRLAPEFGAAQALGPTRPRHRSELEAAVAALDRATGGAGVATELRAEEVRVAADRLGRLTGEIGVEDLLDAIFADFCIGK